MNQAGSENDDDHSLSATNGDVRSSSSGVPPHMLQTDDVGALALSSDAPLSKRLRAKLTAQVTKAFAVILKTLPWISLATGVAGAFLMDRSAKTAWLTIAAAIIGFIVVIGYVLVERVDVEGLEGRRQWAAKIGKMSSVIALQTVLQQSLFFALPFYVRAASLVVGHFVFLLILSAAALSTLWDPLFESLLRRLPARLLLLVMGAFASLNAILPALGMSNRASLVVSAMVAGIGAPLELWLHRRDMSRAVIAVVGAACLVGSPLLVRFVFAAAIPPAPLRLVAGDIGTVLTDGVLVDPSDDIASPTQLVCFTRIAAPRGVKDAIVHSWWKDGRERDRIPVTIEGGNENGFRTFTIKKNLGQNSAGRWACIVETETGQRLGATSTTVTPESLP